MRAQAALLLGVLVFGCGSEPSSAGLHGGSGGSGINQSCSATVPCTQGQCDSASSRCVECLFSSQCEGEQLCRDQRCIDQPSCATSLDCAQNKDELTICDPASQRCVECTAARDCGAAAECVSQRCVSHTACADSRDCAVGSVCDVTKGWCVECVGSEDCEAGNSCVASKCALNCVSDNQCTPQNQLCDKQLGHCVDCLNHGQCPAEYHCSAGSCAFDLCSAGDTTCQGNALVTCSDVGDGFSAPTQCAANEACSAGSGSARCAAWACQPGQTYCEPGTQRRIQCSADGLSVLSQADCAEAGEKCFNGACSNQLCSPGLFCAENAVRNCDSTGQSSTAIQVCAGNEYCDPVSTSCKAQVCAPNSPACSGVTATTCNADGSGFVPGGTNCAALGQSCLSGSCASCPTPLTVRDSMRLSEVYLGNPDYVVLKNQHATCPADIGGLGLRYSYMEYCSFCEPDSLYLSQTLPSIMVPAGGSIYVTETPRSSADVAIPGLVDWLGDARGMVWLCKGACDQDDSSNVMDALSIRGTASSPFFLPPPATFYAPMTGLTTTLDGTHSFTRTAYKGQYPSFLGSDWAIAPATRVGQ